MEKLERGASDVVTDKNSNLTLVRWKDNKVVTAASTFVGKMPLRKAHSYVKAQNGRAEIDQPQSIFLYNKENQQQQISAPLQESWRKSVMKFDITQSITG